METVKRLRELARKYRDLAAVSNSADRDWRLRHAALLERLASEREQAESDASGRQDAEKPKRSPGAPS